VALDLSYERTKASLQPYVMEEIRGEKREGDASKSPGGGDFGWGLVNWFFLRDLL